MFKSVSKMSFLGYDVHSAAMNMAIDEAMAEQSADSGMTFLRFYSFQRPSIILCEFDSVDCLKLDNLDGVDITRRKSGGRPLYLSDNSLSYSISIPVSENDSWAGSLHDVHMRFGGLAADAIAKITGIDRIELTLPRTSSIRFAGKSLAGHAQRLVPGRYLLYQGIIVIEPWDTEAIDRMWHLDKSDIDMIAKLPSMRSIARGQLGSFDDIKMELIKAMTEAFGSNAVSATSKEKGALLSRAESLAAETYANKDWVMRDDRSRAHSAPFCMLWEENEAPTHR